MASRGGKFIFESRREPVLPLPRFVRRVLRFITLAVVIISVALGIGVLGYHFFARLSWIDALLNASMILTGMGPVNPLTTTAAKVFASLYALFSGVIFITVMAIVMAPLVHRLLHRFHVDERDLQ